MRLIHYFLEKIKLNRILALREMRVGLTRIASLQKQTIGVCVIFIIIADLRKIDRCSSMRKPCTRLLKRQKKEYKLYRAKKITSLRHSKPKDFWNLFTSKENTSCQVPLTDFFPHF